MRVRAKYRPVGTPIWCALSGLCRFLVLLAVASCASLPPPLLVEERPALFERHPLDEPGAPQAIAVIASGDSPKTGLLEPARPSEEERTQASLEAAVRGAATGAAIGFYVIAPLVGLAAIALAAGPGVLVALPSSIAPFVAGGAAVGLAAGAAADADSSMPPAVPKEDTAVIERLAADAVRRLQLPELTAQDVSAGARRLAGLDAVVIEGDFAAEPNAYRALRERGFGAAIQLKVKEIGFSGSGADSIISLYVTAEARLVDTATGKPIAQRGLVYVSPQGGSPLWIRDDAALTRMEIERAYRTLAERIVEDLLLQADGGTRPYQAPRTVRAAADTCGLVPRSPKLQWEGGGHRARRLAESGVESVTPVLSWEEGPPTEPGLAQRKPHWSPDWRPNEPPATLESSGITPVASGKEGDVSYDLRIWSVVDGAPAVLAYERQRLREPQHRVETALEPSSTYFWSVRMRYSVDGRERVTRWSAAKVPSAALPKPLLDALFYSRMDSGTLRLMPCTDDMLTPCSCLDFIPALNYYRFRTP